MFKATGGAPLVAIPMKGEYSKRDFVRSARFHNVPFRYPDNFPINTVAACRAFFRAPGPVVTGIPLRWLPDGLVIKTDVIAMLGEDGRALPRRSVSGDGQASSLLPPPFRSNAKLMTSAKEPFK